ncbi:hypothetical protein C357_12349 [Citreicella sp. 357]|nr:hypothetical protein C357_12349 [Citreicella sp. 357]
MNRLTFSPQSGAAYVMLMFTAPAAADIGQADDVIVPFSLCVGTD